MTLRETLGQHFIYRLPGVTHLTPEVADFLVQVRAGGVVLFGYNVQTPAQVAELNHDLQTLAFRAGLPPFIIAVDEEGGQVSRMPAEGQDLIIPSPMAQAVAGKAAIRAASGANARRLRGLGFNLNFAPSLDINNNPANPVIGTRSFGDEPQVVAEMGEAAIAAYLENGLSPCVKHFPGHGDTDVDSHFGMPVVEKSIEQLREFELVPFQRAIEAGVPAIMSAHISYPLVETENRPATLSPRFLNQLLRQEMGFEGLIITDALDMQAVTDRYGLGKASYLSLQAGADVLMSFSMDFDEQHKAFEEVLRLYETGEFDKAAFEASQARLEKWRSRFAMQPALPDSSVEDTRLIAEVARSGLTYHTNSLSLPLTEVSAKRPLLIEFVTEMEATVEEGRLAGPLLEQLLRQKFPTLLRLESAANPTPADVERVCAWTRESDLLIVVARMARRFPAQVELIQNLLTEKAGTVPVVLIAAREPYDLDLFKGAAATVATYGDPPATIRALAELLTGKN